MHFNNGMLIVLILYVFLVPLYVSYDVILEKEHLTLLLLFDFLFMFSKITDLFIGFKNKDGENEPRLSMVIMKNLSYDFFYELFYTFGPFCFDIDKLNSIYYFLFKLPRFGYLFKLSMIINQTLDHYCKSWTVYEIKSKTQQFSIL